MTRSMTPALSLILCSRNDAYMGNSRWRLQTSLDYVGRQVAAIGAADAVEVLVADWGSEEPLKDVVVLDPAAARIVSFLTVPPALARRCQHDSPFAEVIALNAAARRARGTLIGRIDQDTLVGGRFLRTMLDWTSGRTPPPAPLDAALWFANRRDIPYRFAARCPAFPTVDGFVRWFGRRCPIDRARVFYRASVGVWLLHRDRWREAGGYDERMIYMNDMEIDMIERLRPGYPLVDLGPLVGFDFYHLEHYHPGVPRASSFYRAVNDPHAREARGINPNGEGWGLAGEDLEVEIAPRSGRPVTSRWRAFRAAPAVAGLGLATALQAAADLVRYRWGPIGRRRAVAVRRAIRGAPIGRWPQILGELVARRNAPRDATR